MVNSYRKVMRKLYICINVYPSVLSQLSRTLKSFLPLLVLVNEGLYMSLRRLEGSEL